MTQRSTESRIPAQYRVSIMFRRVLACVNISRAYGNWRVRGTSLPFSCQRPYLLTHWLMFNDSHWEKPGQLCGHVRTGNVNLRGGSSQPDSTEGFTTHFT